MAEIILDVAGIDTFYGGAHILRGLSLQLRAGEVVALLGRNGAGKSTVLKAIMGLAPPKGGRIVYRGHDIAGLPPFDICRLGIGYVPEERRIFKHLTVAENLEVGRRPPREGVAAWTPERLYRLFPNLGERRTKAGGRMSGGEQQMLTIARTLMGNPSTLLLDEPSEGIAPVIVEELARVVGALRAEGLSILVSEQNLHFARAVCDRAVILETGAIRYEGTFAELEARPEIGEAYLAV